MGSVSRIPVETIEVERQGEGKLGQEWKIAREHQKVLKACLQNGCASSLIVSGS